MIVLRNEQACEHVRLSQRSRSIPSDAEFLIACLKFYLFLEGEVKPLKFYA